MTKSQLAQLYMPDKKRRTATNRLSEWINYCPQLLTALLATGYKKKQKDFTPAQVQLIYEYLGEP